LPGDGDGRGVSWRGVDAIGPSIEPSVGARGRGDGVARKVANFDSPATRTKAAETTLKLIARSSFEISDAMMAKLQGWAGSEAPGSARRTGRTLASYQ
jgi:hypothetical protein